MLALALAPLFLSASPAIGRADKLPAIVGFSTTPLHAVPPHGTRREGSAGTCGTCDASGTASFATAHSFAEPFSPGLAEDGAVPRKRCAIVGGEAAPLRGALRRGRGARCPETGGVCARDASALTCAPPLTPRAQRHAARADAPHDGG
eukprot:1893820-Prymnesium_polylepis.1